MFCSQCGFQTQNDAKYCSACGNQYNRPAEDHKIAPEPVTDVQPAETNLVIKRVFKSIKCQLTIDQTPVNVQSYDIIATDKGFVFISIEGYTRLGISGGLLTMGLAAAFNYFQDAKHGQKMDNASLKLLLQQGAAIWFNLKESHISVNPLKREGSDYIMVFDHPGSRIMIEGRIIDKGNYKNGSICFDWNYSKPKAIMRLLQKELGYEAILKDTSFSKNSW